MNSKILLLVLFLPCLLAGVLANPSVSSLTITPATVDVGDVITVSVNATPSVNTTLSYVELYYYGMNVSGNHNMTDNGNGNYSWQIYSVMPEGKYNVLINAVDNLSLSNSTTGQFTIQQELSFWYVIGIFIVLGIFIILARWIH